MRLLSIANLPFYKEEIMELSEVGPGGRTGMDKVSTERLLQKDLMD